MSFDLILLDVMMPGESGLDLARDLQRSRATTPVLLLTAMGEAEDRVRGLETGAEDYVVKPFEPRELILRMLTILRRRPAQDDAPQVARSIRFGDVVFGPDGERRDEGRVGNTWDRT